MTKSIKYTLIGLMAPRYFIFTALFPSNLFSHKKVNGILLQREIDVHSFTQHLLGFEFLGWVRLR